MNEDELQVDWFQHNKLYPSQTFNCNRRKWLETLEIPTIYILTIYKQHHFLLSDDPVQRSIEWNSDKFSDFTKESLQSQQILTAFFL